MEEPDSSEAERTPCVGEVVPAFTLPGPDGEITLESEDTNRITVLTFLQDTIADNALSLVGIVEGIKSNLEKSPIRFICVLTEPVPTLDTFREEFEITVDLASDFDRVTTKEYGLLSEKQGGFTSVPRESVFVLDGTLKVAYRWVSETTLDLPVREEIEAAIKELALSANQESESV
jgi:peroxiredoxin